MDEHDNNRARIAMPLAARLILPLLMTASLVVGLSVPAFYDWSGADQSRPSPAVPKAALGIITVGLVFCAALPWLCKSDEPVSGVRRGRLQFSVYTVLFATTLTAVLCALLAKAPVATGRFMVIAGLCYALQFMVRFSNYRWQVVALLCCMYLPFAWTVGHGAFSDHWTMLFFLATAMPGFFYTLLIGAMLQENPHDLEWLAPVLTSLELSAGIWLMQCGIKRSLAFFVFALISSTFGSFVLNALVRI